MQELTLEWKTKRNIYLNGKVHTVEVGQDVNGMHFVQHKEEPRFWLSSSTPFKFDRIIEEIFKVYEEHT